MKKVEVNISKKQLEANKKNALKWWVKTKEWKEVIKYNAVKHWLSSNVYDEDLEKEIIKEYKVEWTLEKMLVKNICISKSRFEKWVELENNLTRHILQPSKYEKVYNSQEEYEEYLQKKEDYKNNFSLDLLEPSEPAFTLQRVEWYDFNFDLEKIQYLVNIIWKYNYQNEVRLSKNIVWLLQTIKK